MASLETLIRQFLDAMAAADRAVWRQADLAVAIHHAFGPGGLRALRERTGLSRKYLRTLVQVGSAFPAGARFPLSVAHHGEALRASLLFSPGAPEAEPAFWLARAAAQRWTRDQLRRAMRRACATAASVAERRQAADRRFTEALRRHARLLEAAAAFNTQDAPFWGHYALVVDVPHEAGVTPDDLLHAAVTALAAQLPHVSLLVPQPA
jgi:hypothetical protein